MNIEKIKSLVNEVESGVSELEDNRHYTSMASLQRYQQKNYNFIQYLGIGKPKVYEQSWKKDGVCNAVQSVLRQEPIDMKELAEELNIYCLNLTVTIMRLKAGKDLFSKAEEIKQYTKEIKDVS